MTEHAAGDFEVTSWSEDQAGGLEDAAKVTVAAIGQRWTGGVQAETVTDTVMSYNSDGTAQYLGYQRLVGRIGERSGSFVLRATGTFDGAVARTELAVVPGSGTGELAGIRGEGVAVAPTGPTGTYELDYSFA